MNVLDTSSHGDRPMCKICYVIVQAKRSYRSDMKTWQKTINLTLRSKVNIKTRHIVLWWYTCLPNMVSLCQIKKKLWAERDNFQKPYKFYLKVKGQRSRSYLDLECTRQIASWWYTHVSNMVSQDQPKKSYGPDTNLHRQTDKKRQTDRQTDRQIDGQTVWILYTP